MLGSLDPVNMKKTTMSSISFSFSSSSSSYSCSSPLPPPPPPPCPHPLHFPLPSHLLKFLLFFFSDVPTTDSPSASGRNPLSLTHV